MLRQLIFTSVLTLIFMIPNAEALNNSQIEEMHEQDEANFVTNLNISKAEAQKFSRYGYCGLRAFPAPFVVSNLVWPKTDLTYKFISFTTDISIATQKSEFKRAFDEWAKHTLLTFTETSGPADIDIKFATRDHGDGNDFDGEGFVLAHAFYPENGDIHMDDDETWSAFSVNGRNIFTVALHEIGHSLGISHSNNKDAIMYPYIRPYDVNTKLHSDDIAAIQELYGTKPQCVFEYDAVMTMNSVTYGFNGTQMMQIDDQGQVIGAETNISLSYPNITSVDEVTYNPNNDLVYIFKDNVAYAFNDSVKVKESLVYPVEYAYVKDDYLYLYTKPNYRFTVDAATMTITDHKIGWPTYDDDVTSATTSATGTVHYFSNKKRYREENGALVIDCTS